MTDTEILVNGIVNLTVSVCVSMTDPDPLVQGNVRADADARAADLVRAIEQYVQRHGVRAL